MHERKHVAAHAPEALDGRYLPDIVSDLPRITPAAFDHAKNLNWILPNFILCEYRVKYAIFFNTR